jgi:prophage antirepressor-like protein
MVFNFRWKEKKSNGDDVFISEGAVYRLICKSTTEVALPIPQAIEFEKWVFDELLPTLREKGTYTLGENSSSLMNSFRTQLQ